MIFINNIEDPKIFLYKNLRFTPESHTENGVFISEGERVVIRVMLSSPDIISVLLTQEYYEKYKELITAKVAEESILIAERSLMRQIVGYHVHSGIMAIAKIPQDTLPNDLPAPMIILNNIVSAENVGSIVRNAAAFGFKSIIADSQSCSPYLRRSVRVSMGNIIDLKVYHSQDIKQTIAGLKARKIKVISAEITDKSVSITDSVISSDSAVIFGNEGWGIDSEILEMSDSIVSIPINSSVPSLNVASSSAIFLWEISKQIKKSPDIQS